jgi:PAS domain S-box-containing protein
MKEKHQHADGRTENLGPEERLSVDLLRNAARAMVLSAGINLVGSLILSANIGRYSFLFGGCLLTALAVKVLLGKVSPRVASVTLVISGSLMTIALCVTGGGLKSPVYLLFTVLSLTAGTLIGKRALFISMAGTILATFGFAFMEVHDLLPQSQLVLTPYSVFFNFTALLVLVWSLQLFITGSLKRALDDSNSEVAYRKEAEEKATQSKLLLRSVLDSTQDLIVAVDNQMRVMAFNDPVAKRVRRQNNVTPYEGMSLQEMLPPYRMQAVREVAVRVLAGEQVTAEATSPAANGGTEFHEELYTPIRSAEGVIEGFTIFVRSITERKRAELSIASNENRLRQIIDMVPHFIFAKDNTGKFILVNQAVAEAYGTTVEELTGKMDADFAKSEEEVRHFREDDNAVIEAGVMKKIPEEVITDAAGKVRILNTQKIPFTFSGTSIPALLGVSVDITERKQAEEALNQERNLLRTLINNLPASVRVYIKDSESRYAVNNLAHLRSLGLSRQEEAIGKTSFDFFPLEQAEAFFAGEQALMQTGEAIVEREERVFNRSLGEERYHLTTKVPIRDSAGKVIGLVGMSIDITERKRAEEALKDSEARFRGLYDNATVGLYRTTPDGQILMSNPAVVKMLGYDSFDELRQRNLEQQDFNPDYPRSEFRTRLEREGTIIGLESEWRRKDGEVIFVSESARVVRDEAGDVLYYDGVVEDITERKRAEAALADERERLAVTLRSIGDGVITTDLQGNIILMNRVAEILTGWSLEEAIGRPLNEVFHIIDEYTRTARKSPFEEVLETKQVIELANHTMLVNRTGHEVVIADSGAPIFDKDSNIIGVVLVFRDTTEKQKMLDHMQRADKLQSLGVLAGGLAHDFNNLLGGIFGYLEMALQHVGTNEKTRRYIEKSLTTFNRAKDLTQQLLTFAKGGVPNRKTGSIAPVLRDNTQFALSGSNVSPQFSLDENLWLCDFDENQLGQIVDNLVINAQQAMPLGGSIVISAENVRLTQESNVPLKEGEYVRFSVADTGTGIPPNILPRIFDPFFTTKQKGSGLGLATVYSIVEKHNGTITVESNQDKGTCFHVYLPRSEKEMVASDSQAVQPNIGVGRILVMDDEETIRETMQDMLESIGYDAVCVDDGGEALRRYDAASLEGRPFDAVIMDLTVPGGMGGRVCIQKLRDKYPTVKAFVSSGYSNDPVLADPTEYGFADKIQKPFRLQELSRLLQRHLSA